MFTLMQYAQRQIQGLADHSWILTTQVENDYLKGGPFFSDIFYNTIIWSCKINTTGYFRFEKYFKSCSPFKIMDIQLNV